MPIVVNEFGTGAAGVSDPAGIKAQLTIAHEKSFISFCPSFIRLAYDVALVLGSNHGRPSEVSESVQRKVFFSVAQVGVGAGFNAFAFGTFDGEGAKVFQIGAVAAGVFAEVAGGFKVPVTSQSKGGIPIFKNSHRRSFAVNGGRGIGDAEFVFAGGFGSHFFNKEDWRISIRHGLAVFHPLVFQHKARNFGGEEKGAALNGLSGLGMAVNFRGRQLSAKGVRNDFDNISGECERAIIDSDFVQTAKKPMGFGEGIDAFFVRAGTAAADAKNRTVRFDHIFQISFEGVHKIAIHVKLEGSERFVFRNPDVGDVSNDDGVVPLAVLEAAFKHNVTHKAEVKGDAGVFVFEDGFGAGEPAFRRFGEERAGFFVAFIQEKPDGPREAASGGKSGALFGFEMGKAIQGKPEAFDAVAGNASALEIAVVAAGVGAKVAGAFKSVVGDEAVVDAGLKSGGDGKQRDGKAAANTRILSSSVHMDFPIFK